MTAADILQLTMVDATGWSALTLTYEDQHIVILNDAHDVPRQESDLHHEASHLMRGHKPCQLVSVGSMTFREYDHEAEQEAAWLAGCLHLPRPALLSALGRGDSEAVIGTRYAAAPRWCGIAGQSRALTVSFKAELLDNFASPARSRHLTKPASIELEPLVNPAIARHIHESFSGIHLQASMSGHPKPTAWQCRSCGSA